MKSQTPTRVLLIDNDPMSHHTIRAHLREAPGSYRVTWRKAFETGLEALGTDDFDVCLVDVGLGRRDGLTLVETAHKRKSFTPIIAVTAVEDAMLDSRARDHGVADYLVKSELAPRSLARSIRYAVSQGRVISQLEHTKERFALAVRGANDGLWDWDLQHQKAWYSERMLTLLHVVEVFEDPTPQLWLKRIHVDDAERVNDALNAHFAGETEHFDIEHRITCSDGTFHWVRARGTSVRDDEGIVTRVAGSLTDVDHDHHQREKHEHAALHDTLTGLPNRALFTERLRDAFEDWDQGKGPNFAVLFLDLDRFKVINDSLGHEAGDALLTGISDRLIPCLRHTDTFARLGGDEFTVLLLHTVEGSAEATADRMQLALKRPFLLQGNEVHASVSIGIAHPHTDYAQAEDLLRDADNALYAAKGGGRAQYAVFSPEMHAKSLLRLKLEQDMRRAIANEEFELYLQPILNVQTRQACSVEALIRWNDPTRGRVSPADFIPLAEDTGLIIDLGRWVLVESARIAALLLRTLGPDRAPLVNFNVSRRQVRSELVDELEEAYKIWPMARGRLIMEITESTLMTAGEEARSFLSQVQATGTQVVIDDFGTGYSSLSSLARLDVSGLKIDRSFIDAMNRDERSGVIVTTIITLAHALGLHATAEGIEEPHQIERLAELGCDRSQGYLFARPMPVDDALDWLEATLDKIAA